MLNGSPNDVPIVTRNESDKFDILISIDWGLTMDDNGDPITDYQLEFVASTGYLVEISECSSLVLNTICSFSE